MVPSQRARRRFVAVPIAAAVALAACTLLDPATGPQRVACVDADSDPAHPVSFANDIRPLMNRTATDPTAHGCLVCHYSTQPSHLCLDASGLDLASLGALRRGGVVSGSSIVIPGKPCESALVLKLQGDYFSGVRMPKDGPPFWSDAEVQLVIDWIAEGANGGDAE
jgi:hypothetical protein